MGAASSQTTDIHRVTLTNGKSIRGYVLENDAGSLVRLRQVDGDTVTVPYSQVERLVREHEGTDEVLYVRPADVATERMRIFLLAGPSFPLGSYGATKGEGIGYASTGLGVAIQCFLFLNNGVFISGTMAYEDNPVDVESLRRSYGLIRSDPFEVSSYTLSSFIVGAGVATPGRLDAPGHFLQILGGFVFNGLPSVAGSGIERRPFVRGPSFAVGVDIGATVATRVHVSMRYLWTDTRITISGIRFGPSGFDSDQQVQTLCLALGVRLQ